MNIVIGHWCISTKDLCHDKAQVPNLFITETMSCHWNISAVTKMSVGGGLSVVTALKWPHSSQLNFVWLLVIMLVCLAKESYLLLWKLFKYLLLFCRSSSFASVLKIQRRFKDCSFINLILGTWEINSHGFF